MSPRRGLVWYGGAPLSEPEFRSPPPVLDRLREKLCTESTSPASPSRVLYTHMRTLFTVSHSDERRPDGRTVAEKSQREGRRRIEKGTELGNKAIIESGNRLGYVGL